MRSLVLSSFLYGCETWTISVDSERKINSFEMRCYRRLLGVPYTAHRTNDSIIGEVRQHIGSFERFFETVKKRKLQWYGHTVRANNLATTFLQGAVPGRRPRGRPRKTWLSNVEEWTRRRPRELLTLARDRKEWRRLAHTASRMVPQRSNRSRDT